MAWEVPDKLVEPKGINDTWSMDFMHDPGKPQQNAYVERYHRTVRYEWLNQHLFESIKQAQESATQWLWTVNNERPNRAMGGLPPVQKRIAA